ncbi:TldD/PmbA family protein [bacterium]|nr:TldD/PmbA family protein [candidate division CSSED10-310 bacterium]
MKVTSCDYLLSDLIDRARRRGAEHAAATCETGHTATIRFAQNRVTQHKTHTDTTITLAVAIGSREALAQSNQVDADGIAELVDRALDLAANAPENTEFFPPVTPQEYQDTTAWFASTADLSLIDRARTVGHMCSFASEQNIDLFGNLETTIGETTIVNSAGLTASQPSTFAKLSLTARTRTGNGSAQFHTSEADWNRLDWQSAVNRTIETALLSRNPAALAPGHYDVILSPKAISEYIMFMFWAMDARMAESGQSFFSDGPGKSRCGSTLFHPSVTLISHAHHPQLPTLKFGQAFGSGGSSAGSVFSLGLPLETTPWITKGVVENLRYSPYYAIRNGRRPVAYPLNIAMEGSDRSRDDLIRDIRTGVLIESFWYVNPTDWNRIALTGLTRDGTFLIENGHIQGPVNNFRFNDSPVDSLNRIAGLSVPEKIHGEYLPSLMPWVRICDFNLSAVSDAV